MPMVVQSLPTISDYILLGIEETLVSVPACSFFLSVGVLLVFSLFFFFLQDRQQKQSSQQIRMMYRVSLVVWLFLFLRVLFIGFTAPELQEKTDIYRMWKENLEDYNVPIKQRLLADDLYALEPHIVLKGVTQQVRTEMERIGYEWSDDDTLILTGLLHRQFLSESPTQTKEEPYQLK